MKKLLDIKFIVGVMFILSCQKGPKKTVNTVLEYDNILIYSDLSSRMEKNPNDTMIIYQLIDYFKNECVKPGIKVNDRSSISFSRINYFKSNLTLLN